MDTVIDNPAASRFELALDGATAFVTYRRSGKTMTLDHAEVPAELEGRGLGSKLVRGMLEAIRKADPTIKVVPRCPFIRAFIRKNPDFAGMVA